MKSLKVGILAIIFSQNAFSQGFFNWFKAVPADSVKTLLWRQNRSIKFYEFTKEITEPSTISFKTLDYDRDLGFKLNKKHVLLNADIQTPITLGGKRRYLHTKKGAWFNSIHIIPQFKVKIFDNDPAFNDLSNPLRTPSYLPRVTYYGSMGYWQDTCRKSAILLSVFHHSNGQDGQEFFQKDSIFSFWKEGLVNTYNGNFDENLVFEFGFVTKKEFRKYSIVNSAYNLLNRQTKRVEASKKLTRLVFSSSHFGVWQLYSKFLYEWHPDSLTNFKFLKQNLYGRNRLNLKFGLSFLTFPAEYMQVKTKGKSAIRSTSNTTNPPKKEQFRIILDASFISDKALNIIENANNTVDPFLKAANFKNRINTNLGVCLRLPNTSNSAIFMQAGYKDLTPIIFISSKELYFLELV